MKVIVFFNFIKLQKMIIAGFRFKLLPIQLNIFFPICFVVYNFSKITINFMNLSAEWQHWLDNKIPFSQIFADIIYVHSDV